MTKTRSISRRLVLPLAIAAGLGLGAIAPASAIPVPNPLAPCQALATASDGTTVSKCSFSVTIPEGFEEVSAVKEDDEGLGGRWKRDEDSDPTCDGMQLLVVLVSADIGSCDEPDVAQALLAGIPSWLATADDTSDCTLESGIFEAKTDSGDYVYLAKISYEHDGDAYWGYGALASNGDGGLFLMYMMGSGDTLEHVYETATQFVGAVGSVAGGVRIDGLADAELSLSDPSDVEFALEAGEYWYLLPGTSDDEGTSKDGSSEDGGSSSGSSANSKSPSGSSSSSSKSSSSSTSAGSRSSDSSSSGSESSSSKSASSSSKSSSGAATTGEKNALSRAQDYLSVMAFSRSGLIDQLEYEGYAASEAEYAVEHCGADWDEQAVLKAQEYLDVMSFSRSGLIDQLEYEGFTSSQASRAATKVGL